jgi:hypothetical protein
MAAARWAKPRVCRGRWAFGRSIATARAAGAANTEGTPCIGLPKTRGIFMVGLTRQSPGQLGGDSAASQVFQRSVHTRLCMEHERYKVVAAMAWRTNAFTLEPAAPYRASRNRSVH